MNIAIVFSDKKDNNYNFICSIIDVLFKFKVKIFIDERYISKFNKLNVNFKNYKKLFEISDIILAIGGDGTIIHIAKYASEYDKPVLGINWGRLGFLSGLEKNELSMLSDLIDGNYKINNRMMIEITVNNEILYALNDVFINRELESPIVDYCVSDSCSEIFKYRSDGIVISTPTGSTAYSLSAGGPVVDTNLECFILTPICAHCLAPRSIVWSSNKDIFINYTLKNNSQIAILVDGKIKAIEKKSGFLTLKKSKKYAQFIMLNDYNFYKNINKFKQGDEFNENTDRSFGETCSP